MAIAETVQRFLELQSVEYDLVPVGSKYSCGFPMVIFQQPTQAFFTGN